MNARQIISNLLKHPYPHDFMRIRAQVVDEFAGDEALAKAELEAYCTEEYALGCREAWQHAQTAARAYLETPESAPNAWQPIATFNLDTLVPCIVWGVLEGETEPASHEAYLLQRRQAGPVFESCRSDMDWRGVANADPYLRRLDITSVTHWMPMPTAPLATTPPKYLIISEERRTNGLVWFYAPDSKGYTACVQTAGRYTESEAAAILFSTSGELSALRESDLPRLQIQHHIDRGYGNNGATLKTLITHALPEPIHATTSATSWHTQPPVNPVSQVNPVQTAPETFEAHGHTWTRHTPGEPCPETNGRMIAVLQRHGPAPGWAGAWHWKWDTIPNFPQFEIIGWRYATPPAASPAAPPHPPASGDDTPRSSAPASAPV